MENDNYKSEKLPRVKTNGRKNMMVLGTCCVPLCSDSKKETLNCHIMLLPKILRLRKRWLPIISKKDLTPTTSQTVYSAHPLF